MSAISEDPFLKPYLGDLRRRGERALQMEQRLTEGGMSLADFASGHEFFGLHRKRGKWIFREWAPYATSINLVGFFSNWQLAREFELSRTDESGTWEITLPENALRHGDLYRLFMRWPGGAGDRIPAYARRVVQDEHTKIFNAQVWAPPSSYRWRNPRPARKGVFPLIYEAHPGMAQEKGAVGSWREFTENVLPRIIEAGYDMIQLMAVMEHPYYASFGYHVSNFFAASSRFGTPEDLKILIDRAHGAGVRVIMDLVHSHAVKNEVEGLSRFDGSTHLYFHEGARGLHEAWDSRCFDYGKPGVLHFLLSNCRFWLDEYRVDGFRFDGVTSMLYLHHGLGPSFTSYERYFDGSVDEDAYVYMSLANKVIHSVAPGAITVAEDVSGMPGLAASAEAGGCGFDYRLAMGVPDCWFKLVNDVPDENWNMNYLWHELTNRRADEKTVSYAECHDQALVGGKTLIFELAGSAIYDSMSANSSNLKVDRAMALHKMIRLATLAAAGNGYLNFMGNEFGHPEWIDFPREGNNWSYHFARRQWSLRDAPDLKYRFLAEFDIAMIGMVGSGVFPAPLAPRLLFLRNDDKILAFARGDLLFIFNFHHSRSVTDYSIEAPPGEYVLLMDTDEARFGGQDRLRAEQSYFTQSSIESGELRSRILVYLPCRVAAVIRRKTVKRRADSRA